MQTAVVHTASLYFTNNPLINLTIMETGINCIRHESVCRVE